MKLTWVGSGKGAGYYVDLYETQDGKQVIIGSIGPDDPIRGEISNAYNKRNVAGASIGADWPPESGPAAQSVPNGDRQ